ncbi:MULTISPECIES: hypothetical protein [Paracoccaceae]|uniref:hypothetical protein n=1 Tax=Paracoccaceae TaxID=31989 RepID=UPI0032980EAA
MTRIAIIGSSHVAAIKSAWDEIQGDFPGLNVSYLAIGGKKYRETYLRKDMHFGLPDDMLQDETIMASSRILLDLSQFDHVWNAGVWQVPQSAMNEILLSFNIDGFETTTFKQNMSHTAFESIVQDLVHRVVPGQQWHHWTTPKLWYSSVPRRNAALTSRKRFQTMDLQGHARGWTLVDDRLRVAMADVGITNIAQPADTMTHTGFTQSQYGSDRKLIQTQTQDMAHMNTAFGKRMWQQFLETSALGPRSQDIAKGVQ